MSSSLRPHGLYSPWNSPGQNTGVGSLSLLWGIFPKQELNLGIPHCRRILYQLSHQGNGRILEWVAYPFASGSSRPRNRTGSLALQAGCLPAELPGKPRGGPRGGVGSYQSPVPFSSPSVSGAESWQAPALKGGWMPGSTS